MSANYLYVDSKLQKPAMTRMMDTMKRADEIEETLIQQVKDTSE